VAHTSIGGTPFLEPPYASGGRPVRTSLINPAWVALLVVGLASGCGGSSASTSTPTSGSHPGGTGVTASTSHIYANSSSVALGPTPEALLTVPKVGVLTASCTAHGGQLSDHFTVAKSTPSNTSLVISMFPGAHVYATANGRSLSPPTGPAAAVSQTWQVTPFSSGSITVATIWVSAQPTPAAFAHHGCVAAAQATVTNASR
jgi:hypothetical protein